MADKKGKMPPQLLEYFKNKNKKKEDGKEMSDKEKRKEALRKKRGMTKDQMDKHPQFKDDDVKEGYKGTMDMSKSHPEAVKKLEKKIADYAKKNPRVPGGKMGVKKEVKEGKTDLTEQVKKLEAESVEKENEQDHS